MGENLYDPDFEGFTMAVFNQLQKMKELSGNSHLFEVDVNKDDLYDRYINGYEEKYNPIYKERRQYDCNACKHGIRRIGNLIAIDAGNNIHTVWDYEETILHPVFAEVANKLSAFIKSRPISNIYIADSDKVGIPVNHSQDDSGVHMWHHFYGIFEGIHVEKNELVRNRKLSDARGVYESFKNGLNIFTPEAFQTVLDLIDDNNLYRGEQYREALRMYKNLLEAYIDYSKEVGDDPIARSRWIWKHVGAAMANRTPTLLKLKSTSIGTLLQDISEGRPLDSAVRAFETIVAPENYKRSKSIVTQKMVDNAKQKLAELNLMSAMERRHATIDDLVPNDTLFMDGVTPQISGKEDDIFNVATPNQKHAHGKVHEANVEEFIKNVLPHTRKMSLLVENRHMGHLVSLLTASDPNAERLFQWGNPFSWSYTGDVTDSIKERVKAAGGNVEGEVRASLSWFNTDDLDLHCLEYIGKSTRLTNNELIRPNNDIYYGDKVSSISRGKLDVDMNAHGGMLSTTPVENITWNKMHTMKDGLYVFLVNQFNQRNYTNDPMSIGFDVELEILGDVRQYHYNEMMHNKQSVVVFQLLVENGKVKEIFEDLQPSNKSISKWGIASQQYIPVIAMTKSPNYWGNNNVGACHYFFFLQDCKAEDSVRGFYNEFLRSDLQEHRKVMEMVGSRVRATTADNQLSGIGFSKSRREECTVEVTLDDGTKQNYLIHF